MTRRACLLTIWVLLIFPRWLPAHILPLYRMLPDVVVSDGGELQYQDGKPHYLSWSSAQLVGKVRLIQHIAGRMSARNMNETLMTALKAANLPREYYQTTTIVNADEAVIGTGFFVRKRIEAGKTQYPWTQFVLDNQGEVRKAWQLTPKSAAVIVLDKEGRIRYVKDGSLNRQEVQQVVNLLQVLLSQASSEQGDTKPRIEK
ncbi:YtfJ family protein [Musicola paradisiaca]|uniref:YtfJ family protein n=1 Tax=Musicola paradisiaca (strain Ech703) TaxID=579405 RepID=C6CAS8_MUSP7|nr:YtfJ family protein [Musicola paradisiaca]ACS84628.1 conserved hypothetical protein [Musicola paradisiaca Ech703]